MVLFVFIFVSPFVFFPAMFNIIADLEWKGKKKNTQGPNFFYKIHKSNKLQGNFFLVYPTFKVVQR